MFFVLFSRLFYYDLLVVAFESTTIWFSQSKVVLLTDLPDLKKKKKSTKNVLENIVDEYGRDL